EPRPADERLGALQRGAARRRLREARARGVVDARRIGARRARRRHAGGGGRPRRPRRIGTEQAVTRPAVRDDLRALEGYHSPQVDVDVRLNTNESPYPPPDGFRDALASELSRVEWHRYPD